MTMHKICASCSSTPLSDRILCDSVDCPILYSRIQAQRDVEDLSDVKNLLGKLEIEAAEKDKNGRDEGEFAYAQDW